MCDIILKTSENCAPRSGAPGVARGCGGATCGPFCSPLVCSTHGVYKREGGEGRGADTERPERQSALRYKSLQTGPCARGPRCCAQRRLQHEDGARGKSPSCIDTVRPGEGKTWRINTLICVVYHVEMLLHVGWCEHLTQLWI